MNDELFSASPADAPGGSRDRREVRRARWHFEGKKTAILEEAQSTKGKGSDMMKTYLDEDSEALDGFEFLTMAEAGEVGHWSILEAA